MKKAGFLTLGLFLIWACSRTNRNPAFVFPETPWGTIPQPANNPATERGVELGKRLFFDPFLSSNDQVSCATCHHPAKAFSDGAKLTRMGVSGNPLIRHSPALFNLAWMSGLFWDGGSTSLEAQVFGPLNHPDEMGMDLKELVDKLQRHPEYPKLFQEVFGSDSITSQRLARALAQYERTLLSFDSPYDRWKGGEHTLSAFELAGYEVYKVHCASCHTEGLFTDNGYHNNGLDSVFVNTEHELIHFGRYRITNDSADIGKFKTPSLRNLGLTAPYMHDGRMASLDAVLKHYQSGILPSVTLDTVLKNKKPLSHQELSALKAFLETLNDPQYGAGP